MNTEKPVTPIHQWTNADGEVLIVRFCDAAGKSWPKGDQVPPAIERNGFQYPTEVGAVVTAPDWNDRAECGGGLHGWAWGMCIGEGKKSDWCAVWQVYGVKPADIVPIDGKVKFRTGVLRFQGTWWEAMLFVLDGQMMWVRDASSRAASATGSSGAASATGLNSKARAGNYGCIALAWWNEEKQRIEMRCARIGGGEAEFLKPNVWYRLNSAGDFVECAE